jgi:hypothetical protein
MVIPSAKVVPFPGAEGRFFSREAPSASSPAALGLFERSHASVSSQWLSLATPALRLSATARRFVIGKPVTGTLRPDALTHINGPPCSRDQATSNDSMVFRGTWCVRRMFRMIRFSPRSSRPTRRERRSKAPPRPAIRAFPDAELVLLKNAKVNSATSNARSKRVGQTGTFGTIAVLSRPRMPLGALYNRQGLQRADRPIIAASGTGGRSPHVSLHEARDRERPLGREGLLARLSPPKSAGPWRAAGWQSTPMGSTSTPSRSLRPRPGRRHTGTASRPGVNV